LLANLPTFARDGVPELEAAPRINTKLVAERRASGQKRDDLLQELAALEDR
jgi:hypothetical protein